MEGFGMDSRAYRAAVRARLEKELNHLRIRITGQREIKTAIRELTEQYLSICEAENFPRWEFSQNLLNRAYEAFSYVGEGTETLATSATEQHSLRALELTPEILRNVFKGKRHRKP